MTGCSPASILKLIRVFCNYSMNEQIPSLHASSAASFGEARIRVRYAETDQMGVVYYANYLIWFEIGRVEWMRQSGFDYKQMEIEDGCRIPVVEATCRYKAPARYDDELIIQTEAAMPRGHILKFSYKLLRSTDRKLLAEGETTHVVTDSAMKRRVLPEKYASAFQKVSPQDRP